MKYNQMVQAIFIERPNRFIAMCEVAGQVYKVHVKNTGRCKELLIPGATVYLEYNGNPMRKTQYSLITVEKGDKLINMDSGAPNVVAYEALKSGYVLLPGLEKERLTLVKREVTYDASRFDLYVETPNHKAFIEVKGVTLEEEGITRFPDAPTARGTKHLKELIKAKQEGYMCYILFVIQMEEASYFTPHYERDLAFGEALEAAQGAGVEILAYTCQVTPNTLQLKSPVKVQLNG